MAVMSEFGMKMGTFRAKGLKAGHIFITPLSVYYSYHPCMQTLYSMAERFVQRERGKH